MKNFNKIVLFLAILPLKLLASNLELPTGNDKSTVEISKQDEAIVKIILSMKEAVDANLQAQKQIDAANGMFEYNKKPLASDVMSELVMAMNQYKASFARLLDGYLIQFGQLYEKKAGLLGAYQNVSHISSKTNQAQPITLNEHALLISELQRAVQQSDWGTTVTVELPLQRQNQTMVQLLNLDQIISAISQVPLPSNYSATAIVAGVAAAGAIAAAGYFAYQAMNQPKATNQPNSDAGKRRTVSAAVLKYEKKNNIDITGQSLDQRTKNFIEQNNNKSAQRTSAQDLGFNNPTENVESAKAPELLDPSSIYSIKKPNSGIGDDEFKFADESQLTPANSDSKDQSWGAWLYNNIIGTPESRVIFQKNLDAERAAQFASDSDSSSSREVDKELADKELKRIKKNDTKTAPDNSISAPITPNIFVTSHDYQGSSSKPSTSVDNSNKNQKAYLDQPWDDWDKDNNSSNANSSSSSNTSSFSTKTATNYNNIIAKSRKLNADMADLIDNNERSIAHNDARLKTMADRQAARMNEYSQRQSTSAASSNSTQTHPTLATISANSNSSAANDEEDSKYIKMEEGLSGYSLQPTNNADEQHGKNSVDNESNAHEDKRLEFSNIIPSYAYHKNTWIITPADENKAYSINAYPGDDDHSEQFLQRASDAIERIRETNAKSKATDAKAKVKSKPIAL